MCLSSRRFQEPPLHSTARTSRCHSANLSSASFPRTAARSTRVTPGPLTAARRALGTPTPPRAPSARLPSAFAPVGLSGPLLPPGHRLKFPPVIHAERVFMKENGLDRRPGLTRNFPVCLPLLTRAGGRASRASSTGRGPQRRAGVPAGLEARTPGDRVRLTSRQGPL